jgi:16S rRNA processing protein RimM
VGELVPIGFVVRAHGLRGLVRVRADGDALLTLRQVFVGDRAMTVVRAQRERGEFLVELEGVAGRDAAEALRGQKVAIERSQLPPAADNEVYVSQLIGCAVSDAAGQPLGEVIAVDSNGAQELLTIRGATEWQLPFVDGLVLSVDVAARRIVCDPPPGLINLDDAEEA